MLSVENLDVFHGDAQALDGVSLSVPEGRIIGVIGPNGAGKTTLFRMIMGQEQPDSGTLKISGTVRIGCVDQSRDALDPADRALVLDAAPSGMVPESLAQQILDSIGAKSVVEGG